MAGKTKENAPVETTPAVADALPDAAPGFGWIVYGDKDGWLIASKGTGERKQEVRRIKDVLVQFPCTDDAFQAAFAGSAADIVLADGTTVRVTGTSAGTVRAYKLAMETIRGMMAQKNKDGSFRYSDADIIKYAAKFNRVSGRERVGVVKTTHADIEKLAKLLFERAEGKMTELEAYQQATKKLLG